MLSPTFDNFNRILISKHIISEEMVYLHIQWPVSPYVLDKGINYDMGLIIWRTNGPYNLHDIRNHGTDLSSAWYKRGNKEYNSLCWCMKCI